MVAAIFAMTFAGAFAQRGQSGSRGGQQKESMTPVQRAERMTIKMTEELGLTEDQKQKIYKINLENAQKREAQREERQADQTERRAAMQAQNKEQNEQIETLLTPEQITKWEEVKKEGRRQMQEGSKGKRGKGHGNRGSGSGSGTSTL